MGWIRDIKHGFRNLYAWLPLIWKDRDWDHGFLFEMLQFKLSRMEKCLRNGIHLHADETADKVKLCVLLLDRINKDEYHEMVFKHHDKKWGETDLTFTKCKDNPEMSELHISRENVNSEEDKEQERKEYRAIMKRPDELMQQDIDMLFETMRKHIRGWWD